jgi:hypothetical protein
MDRAAPRTAYDDLYETSSTSEVEPERFDELADGEPFTTGWVTVASVLDSEGRILLIYDEDDEAWVTNPPLKGWACRWTPVLAASIGRQANTRRSRSVSPTSGRGDVSPLRAETSAPHGVTETRYSSPRCSPR